MASGSIISFVWFSNLKVDEIRINSFVLSHAKLYSCVLNPVDIARTVNTVSARIKLTPLFELPPTITKTSPSPLSGFHLVNTMAFVYR